VTRAFLTDGAKADAAALLDEDREVAVAALRLVKRLENEPYLGDQLREKSNLKPLAQADCRKVRFDRPDRRSSAKPRHRYRLVYRIEPHEGSPETIVVMALGIKPRVYRDATARAAARLREQATERVRRTRE
jgi:Txe/YoeB family toxin of Txe-Axe toxin-antitoxin module